MFSLKIVSTYQSLGSHRQKKSPAQKKDSFYTVISTTFPFKLLQKLLSDYLRSLCSLALTPHFLSLTWMPKKWWNFQQKDRGRIWAKSRENAQDSFISSYGWREGGENGLYLSILWLEKCRIRMIKGAFFQFPLRTSCSFVSQRWRPRNFGCGLYGHPETGKGTTLG